jgi:hypothetical protein
VQCIYEIIECIIRRTHDIGWCVFASCSDVQSGVRRIHLIHNHVNTEHTATTHIHTYSIRRHMYTQHRYLRSGCDVGEERSRVSGSDHINRWDVVLISPQAYTSEVLVHAHGWDSLQLRVFCSQDVRQDGAGNQVVDGNSRLQCLLVHKAEGSVVLRGGASAEAGHGHGLWVPWLLQTTKNEVHQKCKW